MRNRLFSGSKDYYPAVNACRFKRRLDQDLATTENEEKRAAQNVIREVQVRLFLMRQRFRELRC